MAMNLKTTLVATAVMASAAGVGVFSPAGVARAYTGFCNGPIGPGSILQVREFALQEVGNGNSLATIRLDAAMSESDAQLFVNSPGDKADFFVFGDDSDSDELLAQFKPDRYWVSPAGLGMSGGAQVSNTKLNEDSFGGLPPSVDADDFTDNRDEFYVDVRMGDIRNGSAHRVETCRLSLTE
jgi:hypothetical protein